MAAALSGDHDGQNQTEELSDAMAFADVDLDAPVNLLAAQTVSGRKSECGR